MCFEFRPLPNQISRSATAKNNDKCWTIVSIIGNGANLNFYQKPMAKGFIPLFFKLPSDGSSTRTYKYFSNAINPKQL